MAVELTGLMKYLADKLQSEFAAEPLSEDELGLLDRCYQVLKSNPPVALGYVSIGLSLRLADGTEVSILDEPVDERTNQGAVAITGPGTFTRQDRLPPDNAVPIT